MAAAPVSLSARFVRGRLAHCTAASALLLAGSAHADTIHSNFGPGDAYGFGGFYTAFDFGSVGGSVEDYDLANKFSTGSSAYRFDSARLGLFRTNGATGDDFTLWLMADAGGAPGAILETISYTAAVSPVLGNTVDVAASGTTLLAANTAYWIGIGSTFPDSVVWNLNSIGASGPNSMAYARNGGAWDFTNTPLAFAVNGTLVPPTVPEPGSLALVALAIAAAVAVSRQRRAAR